MSEISRYEKEQFAKIETVVKAAKENSSCRQNLTITTTGTDPHCSIVLPAYVFEKFLKAPAADR